MNQEILQKISLFFAAVALFSFGFLGGSLSEKIQQEDQFVHPVEGVNMGTTVPVFTVSEVSKKGITGYVNGGELRLVGGKEVVVNTGSGEVFLPLGKKQWKDASIVIPPGSQFVASKKGKKLYPIKSTAAQKLSVENRIYFTTEAAGIAAGYSP